MAAIGESQKGLSDVKKRIAELVWREKCEALHKAQIQRAIGAQGHDGAVGPPGAPGREARLWTGCPDCDDAIVQALMKHKDHAAKMREGAEVEKSIDEMLDSIIGQPDPTDGFAGTINTQVYDMFKPSMYSFPPDPQWSAPVSEAYMPGGACRVYSYAGPTCPSCNRVFKTRRGMEQHNRLRHGRHK